MRHPKVSVVIAALNEGENLVDTVRCILQNSRDSELEVIAVDDGSVDGSGRRVHTEFHDCTNVVVLHTENVGVARARNHGAAAAIGEVLIFLDAHCFTPSGWIGALVAPLEDPRVGMVGPAFASLADIDGPRGYGAIWRGPSLEIEWLARKRDEPYEVPLHPGGCQAVRRADFQSIGGYDAGMGCWGSEGEELSLRYWMMGYGVVVQPRLVLHHLFRTRHPYRVQSPQVIYNRLRMALMYFGTERLHASLDHYSRMGGFSQIVLWLLKNDLTERRDHYERHRRRDDDWFFARFANAEYSPSRSSPPRIAKNQGGLGIRSHMPHSNSTLEQRKKAS